MSVTQDDAKDCVENLDHGHNDDDIDNIAAENEAGCEKKKKKKKKKKTGLKLNDLPMLDNDLLRLLNNWPEQQSRQTWEPSIVMDKIYLQNDYPIAEEVPRFNDNGISRDKISILEEREKSFISEVIYAREAAEAHRQTRKYLQSYIKPGISMIDICQKLEKKSEELIGLDGLVKGKGFPTGCSLNNCAAHYTPNYGDKTILQQGDICKIDFGIHSHGRIIDSAFSVAFEPHFDELIKSTQDGTNTGIGLAGIDARLDEIGCAIEEVISSYECTINNRTYPIKPVRNLMGHKIDKYRIHAGKSVPIVKGWEKSVKMEELEFYAIETFATTGKGIVKDDGQCSHYMRNFESPDIHSIRLKGARELLKVINTNFGSLAFCRRWLDDCGQTRHILNLKNLVDNNIVQTYPPLSDISGSYTSQMEHTLVLRPMAKEILSRGPDY